MLKKLAILIVLLPCSLMAKNHCAFIDELEKILKTDPVASANQSIYTSKGKFLSVGNGYSPARPGFKTNEEMICAMQYHGFNMVWAGGDVMGCKNQSSLAQAVEIYARTYNQQVKATLIEQGSYQCAL